MEKLLHLEETHQKEHHEKVSERASKQSFHSRQVIKNNKNSNFIIIFRHL